MGRRNHRHIKMIGTKKELEEKGLHPVKHKGQNFLVSSETIEKIIKEVKIKKDEIVLEVGPGTGNLTKALLEAGAEVITVEKDHNLSEVMKSKFKNQKSKIIEKDILKFDENSLKNPYRIIANIPYYLTGKLIQKFIFSKNKPSELILMVQKEVGERITATPPKANYLSSLVQHFADAKMLFKVKKENFWPQPEVDSAIISIKPKKETGISDPERYVDFLKHTFKQPRQTLFNNLRKSGLANSNDLEKLFQKIKIDKNMRPQNLDSKKLIEIFKNIMVY